MGLFAKRGYRVGVFMDAPNIYAGARDAFGCGVNHALVLKAALDDNRLYRAIAYAVRMDDKIDGWKKALAAFGYEVKEKERVFRADNTAKANWDIGICMDVVGMVEHNCIDMVVIASGDGDFVPLVEWCKHKGRVVRVIAVERVTSRALIKAVDEFAPIDRTMLLRELASEKVLAPPS